MEEGQRVIRKGKYGMMNKSMKMMSNKWFLVLLAAATSS
jgi:hypothetical protein